MIKKNSTRLPRCLSRLALLCALAPLALIAAPPTTPAAKTPAATNAPVEIPKSVFVVPTIPKEGRDPFFPKSSRVYNVNTASKTNAPAASNISLTLDGFSRSPTLTLAIINGKSMAEGEEIEVNAPGGRIRVKCIEIKTDSVIVEVGGLRRELRPKQPF